MTGVTQRTYRIAAIAVAAAAVHACTADRSDGPAVPASLSITPSVDSTIEGSSMKLTATVKAGSEVLQVQVLWSSSDTAVARVDSTGLVSARAPGSAWIAAAGAGARDSALLLVRPVPVANLTVSPGRDTLDAGATFQLAAVVTDSSGNELSGRTITWTSGDTTVATVSASGAVRGLRMGTVVITAMCEGKAASATAVVRGAVFAVAVSPATGLLRQGQTVQLTATPQDSAGNALTDRPVTWSTSNTRVATVSASGLVTARDSGTARIAAAVSSGKNGGAQITVTLVPVANVSVTPTSASIPAGASVGIGVTAKDSAGNVLPGRAVSYSSSNSSLVTIRSNGAVIGKSAGVDTVTVTVDGKSATAVITVTAAPSQRPGWYASLASGGDGSFFNPWDLATALAGGGGKVQPGDTIWVRGGTYTGDFKVTVGGVSGRPVVVRQFPGERATIDGIGTPVDGTVLDVKAPWVEVWDLELTLSDPNRFFAASSHFSRGDMIANYASHTRYIDLIVHDGGVGFYNDGAQSDVEIDGCIFYNNGWQAPDHGHGHAIYLRSNTGPVTAQGNVVFNQFGYGFHAYVDPGEQLRNISLIGNVSFNNGTLSNNSTSANILLGGRDYATGDVLQDNLTYFSPGAGRTNVMIGYPGSSDGSITLTGNHFAGGDSVLWIGKWQSVSLSGNALSGPRNLVTLADSILGGFSFNATQYFRDALSSAWSYLGQALSLAAWQVATGLGTTGQASSTPSSPDVFVRATPHVSGRAVVAVYNWTQWGSVSVDLSSVLKAGDAYVVKNVQNLFGSPVASGTYQGGAVNIPIASVTPPVPVGFSSSPAPGTGVNFAVFLVTKQ